MSNDDFLIFRNLNLPEIFEVKKDIEKEILDLDVKEYIEILKTYDKINLFGLVKKINSKQQLQFNLQIISFEEISEITIRPLDPYKDIQSCLNIDTSNKKFNDILFMEMQTMKYYPEFKILGFVALENNVIIGVCLFQIKKQADKILYIKINSLITKDIKKHYFSACCLIHSVKKYAESKRICIIFTEIFCNVNIIDFWKKQGFKLNNKNPEYDILLDKCLNFYLLGFKNEDFMKSAALMILEREKAHINFKNGKFGLYYIKCNFNCKMNHSQGNNILFHFLNHKKTV